MRRLIVRLAFLDQRSWNNDDETDTDDVIDGDDDYDNIRSPSSLSQRSPELDWWPDPAGFLLFFSIRQLQVLHRIGKFLRGMCNKPKQIHQVGDLPCPNLFVSHGKSLRLQRGEKLEQTTSTSLRHWLQLEQGGSGGCVLIWNNARRLCVWQIAPCIGVYRYLVDRLCFSNLEGWPYVPGRADYALCVNRTRA